MVIIACCHSTAADKAQTAICADETYCEKWDDAGAIPQDVLSKP